MGARLRACIVSWFSVFLMASAVLAPGPLHAEECDLSTPLGTLGTLVDATPATTFLPSGSTGQILVRWKEPTTVRVFDVEGLDRSKWKDAPAQPVTSTKSLPEKSYEGRGFSTTDSSIVSFILPNRADYLWGTRTFVLRLCGKGADKTASAWATFRAPVSSPLQARLMSIVAIAVLYMAFAYAIYKMHKSAHPLAAKWPSYKGVRNYSWYEYLNPVVLTAGSFQQGSIQKLQVLLFTLLVGGMVLSLVLTLGVLLDLSPTVALLLGISAVGAAVAQKTTTSNERLQFENWAWLVRKDVLPINQPSNPRWSDLVMTGREFDIYKLQTLIFSGVVAVALLATGEDRLGSFDVPQTLLGILGLSQVVYVAGALVRPPSASDLDKAVGELRGLENTLQIAVAHNVDTDSDGKLPTPLPAPAVTATAPATTTVPATTTAPAATTAPVTTTAPATTAARAPAAASPTAAGPGTAAARAAAAAAAAAKAPNAARLYYKKANQVEIMLESTLEVEVDNNRLAPEL